MDRLVALSIDLDALDLYMGIHGLAQPLSERARDAVPARAAERFGELCASLGVEGTAFVVGRDLAAGRGTAQLKALLAGGHELASHSYSHDYALSRLPRAAIDDDLGRAEAQLRTLGVSGAVGFRAPGYTLSAKLLAALAARGAAYDSSLLPSPPYYAAKAAVMGAMALRGRRSASILGSPAQLFAGRAPAMRAGVVELPVAVLPGLRVPYIGTLLCAAPERATRLAGRLLARDRLVVVELHGADLCDAQDGVPPQLLARQRELAIPAAVKVRRIQAAMRALLATRRAVVLRDAARLVSDRATA